MSGPLTGQAEKSGATDGGNLRSGLLSAERDALLAIQSVFSAQVGGIGGRAEVHTAPSIYYFVKLIVAT